MRIRTSDPSPVPVLQTHYSSIDSVHGHRWLNFEPPQLLTFDFDADLDPAFHLMRAAFYSTLFTVSVRLLLKGLGHELEFKYLQKFMVLGLGLSLYKFLNFKMSL